MSNIQHYDGTENTPLAIPNSVYSERAEHCGDPVESRYRQRPRGDVRPMQSLWHATIIENA